MLQCRWGKEDGSLHLCLDPGDLNPELERNAYHMRTIDEVCAELNGRQFFTLLDAKSGYWQVKLDEASSMLTTFNTPWGKYRYLHLPFGLKVSSDVFQEQLEAVLKLHSNVTRIADDCLVMGKQKKRITLYCTSCYMQLE